ncbi:hypothetical protein BAE44_0008612 [Dichanthelium oligosanthes]|uniref:Bifunctional inhibitor/plant lipid transfer protein/seed storage helical domain-containing protein n=1 Tax=Dichanthelium oligosanthes TaxID=888268 RepID=A0A1E5VZ11_9POAL|nr:hypothetical protein BAE44_0008612 [Dichanthelium oligosanthes]
MMRGLLVLAVLVAAACQIAEGAGECGATPPDTMALRLAPCASAAQDPSSAPSAGCCNAVHTIGKQSPQCLCAVMLSNTAKTAGIKPEVAISIPKRCNLADRPVGYKCGVLKPQRHWATATTTMAPTRSLFLLALVLLAGGAAVVLAAPRGAAADGECGATRPDHLALKLAPCASAVEDPESSPSGGCCAAVRDIGRRHSPECLCALLLSDTGRHSGINLEDVITIPKRCNLASRPVGYKCGEYTLPGLHE